MLIPDQFWIKILSPGQLESIGKNMDLILLLLHVTWSYVSFVYVGATLSIISYCFLVGQDDWILHKHVFLDFLLKKTTSHTDYADM